MGAQIFTMGTRKQKKNNTLLHQQKSISTGINTITTTQLGDDAVRGPHDLRRAARHQSSTSTCTCVYLVSYWTSTSTCTGSGTCSAPEV